MQKVKEKGKKMEKEKGKGKGKGKGEGEGKGKEKGKVKGRQHKKRWTNARTDGHSGDFILGPMLCIASDRQKVVF